jgi:hypothetical protein
MVGAYNGCGCVTVTIDAPVATEDSSWGSVKALYREGSGNSFTSVHEESPSAWRRGIHICVCGSSLTCELATWAVRCIRRSPFALYCFSAQQMHVAQLHPAQTRLASRRETGLGMRA